MFPYTDIYRIARELWMLSLRGVLEWKNEPDQLLKPAIEQGNRELQRLRGARGKTASQKAHLTGAGRPRTGPHTKPVEQQPATASIN
jgi:hypothetical protein